VIEVSLNGRDTQLPDRATIADAIVAAGGEPDGRGIAVALDGEVVPRADFESRALSAGQRVEVVAAIQGGS
jgi:sulfur carrier protein